MLMFKERWPAIRTLRGWAISALQEAGAIRECEGPRVGCGIYCGRNWRPPRGNRRLLASAALHCIRRLRDSSADQLPLRVPFLGYGHRRRASWTLYPARMTNISYARKIAPATGKNVSFRLKLFPRFSEFAASPRSSSVTPSSAVSHGWASLIFESIRMYEIRLRHRLSEPALAPLVVLHIAE
jgi:hypothetical protein